MKISVTMKFLHRAKDEIVNNLEDYERIGLFHAIAHGKLYLRFVTEVGFFEGQEEELVPARIVIAREGREEHDADSCCGSQRSIVGIVGSQGWSLDDDITRCIERTEVSCTGNDAVEDEVGT